MNHTSVTAPEQEFFAGEPLIRNKKGIPVFTDRQRENIVLPSKRRVWEGRILRGPGRIF